MKALWCSYNVTKEKYNKRVVHVGKIANQAWNNIENDVLTVQLQCN